MFDIHTPLQAKQSSAARGYLGLSQAKAAALSGLPLHLLKRFEAPGGYTPNDKFLTSLREFYEGQGFDFDDTPAPGAGAKDRGQIFPAGVVGSAAGPRALKTTVQHMRIAITDEDEIGRLLDLIEENEQKAEDLLEQPIAVGFLSGLSAECEARHAEALKLLAENGTQFARLFGRQVGGAPKPEVLAGSAKPETHADLLHRSQADAHLAVEGNRDAKARHLARKPAKTLSGALFA